MSTWKGIVVWLVLSGAGMADEAVIKHGLTLEATHVDEQRSTEKKSAWRNRCEVGLTFSGPPIDGAIAVTELVVNVAYDDTEKSLIRNRINVEPRLRDPNPKPPCGQLTFRLDLLAANRAAQKIHKISGEVTVFTPRPEDTLVIPDIRATPGKPLCDGLLAKHRVLIVYLDKELLAKPKKELVALLDNQFEKSDLGTLGELESLPRSDDRYVHFLMRDPEKRIMQWHFVDAMGKILPGDLRSIGSVRVYRPAKGVQEPLRLRVCFRTEAGLNRIPFEIRDIPLP